MINSGEFIFFAVFGGAMVLAGLTADLTGDMRVVQRNWENLPPLKGGVAALMASLYLLWGAFLGLNALQLAQNQRPTAYNSVARSLQLNDDARVLILLGITFTLVILPAFIVMFQRRNVED